MLLRCQNFDSSTTMSDYDSRLLTPSGYCSIQQNGASGANFLRCTAYVTCFLQGFKPIPAGVNGFFGFRFRSNGQNEMHIGVIDDTNAIHLGDKRSVHQRWCERPPVRREDTDVGPCVAGSRDSR